MNLARAPKNTPTTESNRQGQPCRRVPCKTFSSVLWLTLARDRPIWADDFFYRKKLKDGLGHFSSLTGLDLSLNVEPGTPLPFGSKTSSNILVHFLRRVSSS